MHHCFKNMSRTATAACLLMLALLPACSEKTTAATPPVAAAPAAPAKPMAPPTTGEKIDEILLKAVFGKQYRPASRDALVSMPDLENRSATGQYVVSAAANTVLKTGETVLVVNGNPADDAGEAQTNHAEGGLLSVYLLRQAEGKWQILKRHENITNLGSDGQIGTVEWTMLAIDKPGLAVINGGTWQGNSIASLALFDLKAATMRDLIPAGVAVHSDNQGACDPKSATECWTVTGKWRFAAPKAAADYDDLLVDFSGEKSERAENADGEPAGPRKSEKIGGAARYAYDGKQYKLVEGENVVPGI
jgi:hypothetical protein